MARLLDAINKAQDELNNSQVSWSRTGFCPSRQRARMPTLPPPASTA